MASTLFFGRRGLAALAKSRIPPLVQEASILRLSPAGAASRTLSVHYSDWNRRRDSVSASRYERLSAFAFPASSTSRSTLTSEIRRFYASSSSSSALKEEKSGSDAGDASSSQSNANNDPSPNTSSPEVASPSSSSTSSSPEASPPPPPPQTRVALYRRAVAEYGVVVPIFHVSLALTSLGFFYVLVTAGVDFDSLFSALGVDSSSSSRVATGVSTFALAYAVHKLFAPMRIAVTLAVAPFLVRLTRKHVTPAVAGWTLGVRAMLSRKKS